MLSYLVSSPARRRLLEVLWTEGARGSVTALGATARVSFASAYRELHAMRRHELVVTSQEGGVTVFAANEAHPLAAAMRALVAYRPAPAPTRDASVLRAQLASLGAPLGSEAAEAPPVEDLEALVVEGAELARREPATARAMPVLLHRLADRLDPDRLERLARAHRVRHALGFLLAVAGKLGGDPRLTRLARRLRDRRVHDQPFFLRPTRARAAAFPLATRWGFRLGMDEATFASTFTRFAGKRP